MTVYLYLVVSICIGMTGQTTSAAGSVAGESEAHPMGAIGRFRRNAPEPSVTLNLFAEDEDLITAPYDYLTVDEVLQHLEGDGELLEPEDVLSIVSRERYGNLELFDGITANQLLGMNKWTTFDCKREAFEKLLNQCDSWDKRKTKSSPNEGVMENMRYFCRRVFHERATTCENIREDVLRDEVIGEKFLDDLRDETDKYLVDEEKGIDLKAALRNKRTSVEKFIGGRG